MHSWKVVPLSEGQLKDVRPEDILADGLFRKCETYRGGGGYDQFPIITERYFGQRHHLQFIVQLFGCNLDCPYCYVTREGVWGKPVPLETGELVDAFLDAHREHGTTVFHLMGGAPALQMKHWRELYRQLAGWCDFNWMFHSDLMLSERDYDPEVVRELSLDQSFLNGNALYAVDVKGLTAEEHLRNTRKPWDEVRFWHNLTMLEWCDFPFYFTFTSVADQAPLWDFYRRNFPNRLDRRQRDAFSIDLIEYGAMPYVDRVPWGAQRD